MTATATLEDLPQDLFDQVVATLPYNEVVKLAGASDVLCKKIAFVPAFWENSMIVVKSKHYRRMCLARAAAVEEIEREAGGLDVELITRFCFYFDVGNRRVLSTRNGGNGRVLIKRRGKFQTSGYDMQVCPD